MKNNIQHKCRVVALAFSAAALSAFALSGCTSATSSEVATAIDDTTLPIYSVSENQTETTYSTELTEWDSSVIPLTNEEMDLTHAEGAYVCGTLTNNTGEDINFVEIDYKILDADGNNLGTAWTNIQSDFVAGATWNFEAISPANVDEAVDYELIGVTIRK